MFVAPTDVNKITRITVYTRLLAALFLPGIWPVFYLCGLYAQHTQRDKVFYQE